MKYPNTSQIQQYKNIYTTVVYIIRLRLKKVDLREIKTTRKQENMKKNIADTHLLRREKAKE